MDTPLRMHAAPRVRMPAPPCGGFPSLIRRSVPCIRSVVDTYKSNLTPSDRAALGITEEFEASLTAWMFERIGLVVSSSGHGASGVFVTLDDGRAALLTARHVILSAVLTGEISIMRASVGGGRSFEPIAIRMHPRSDAALLYLPPDAPAGASLSFEEWNPAKATPVSSGMAVVSCGAPGEWRPPPDQQTRKLGRVMHLFYWTHVNTATQTGVNAFVYCDVDESSVGIPLSFKGMSGGPVFGLDKVLLGVNHGERRKINGGASGIISVSHLSGASALVNPYRPSPHAPTDYDMYESLLPFDVFHRDDKKRRPIRVHVVTEVWRSKHDPDHSEGRLCRIMAIQFPRNKKTARYVINIESVFTYCGDGQGSELPALIAEIEQIFQDTRFEIAKADSETR